MFWRDSSTKTGGPHCNTKGYSSTYLAMGFANVRAGTRYRCAGQHALKLKLAGCGSTAIDAWCSGTSPGPPPAPASSPFPGSRLITSAEGAQLNAWSNQTVGQKWTVCYSSFTMDKKNPASFHDACDKFKPTVTVAHTTSGCGKGICGKCKGTKGCTRSCSTDGTQCPVTGKPCGHVYPG